MEKFLQFLRHKPEALLFEGASLESARHTVEEQGSRLCGCRNTRCLENWERVLTLLDQEFQHFQCKRVKDGASPSEEQEDAMLRRWQARAHEVQTSSKHLRELRAEETTGQQQILEMTAEKSTFQEELVNLWRSKRLGSTTLYRLTCSKSNDKFAQKSVLEYQVGISDVKIKKMEESHTAILMLIRKARREQHDILKNIFRGCKRYTCIQAKN